MAHDDDTEISREADALIDAYRRRAEPPRGAAERGWQALGKRISAGEQDPLGEEPIASERPRWRPWVLGLAAAAAVLLALSLSSRTAEQGGLGAALQATFEGLWGPREQQAPVHTRTAHDPASTPTPTPRAPDAAPPPVPQARSPEPAPTSQPTGDLARQLEQVRAAGEAVRTGDGAAALAAADAYLRTHPTGTFAPEARLHRAAALCLLGQVDEAREAAAAFARDYPTSPLRPRVAAVCDQ